MTAESPLNPWVKRANTFGCFVLVLAIAYVIVRIVYLFVDSSAGHTPPSVYGSASSMGAGVTRSEEKIDTSAIAMWSLFGKEGQKPTPKQKQEEVVAKETKLNLELQGVFVAPNEDNSTAMIAESRRDSKLYHIGDKVPGNATLSSVHQDKVLLNRNGQLEALYFAKSDSNSGLSKSSSSRNSRSRVDRNSRKTTSRTSRSSRSSNFAGAPKGLTADARTAMASQMVSTLKEQMDQNPDSVLGQFGLQANNGRGYRVSQSANPMLSAIGARPGDLIIAVNGNQLGDPSQDINLIEQVMSEGSIRATLERDGTQFDSEFSIPGG